MFNRLKAEEAGLGLEMTDFERFSDENPDEYQDQTGKHLRTDSTTLTYSLSPR